MTHPHNRQCTVLLLAGKGPSTDIVANYLASSFPGLVVVTEQPQSRSLLVRRRARRLGWVEVAGQVLFIVGILPILRRRSIPEVARILAEAGVDNSSYSPDFEVSSVNDPTVLDLIEKVSPDVVVVNGTRIISSRTLGVIKCPVINMHSGITPRYRGVHGGYWALVEGRPHDVGTTLHLVDSGIDTGTVLAQERFDVKPRDSIATLEYRHVIAGLRALSDLVSSVLAGSSLEPVEVDGSVSKLWYHPTIWGYLWHRWRNGVR